MPCHRVPMQGGGFAIVCGPKLKAPMCSCKSGRRAELLCDWITEPGKTCDAKICPVCTTSPARDKDLCPEHAKAWETHPSNPRNKK